MHLHPLAPLIQSIGLFTSLPLQATYLHEGNECVEWLAKHGASDYHSFKRKKVHDI